MAGLGTSLLVDGHLADSVSPLSLESGDAFNNTLFISFSIYSVISWISQANHIFHCLNIMSNFENYGTASAYIFYLG